MNPDDPASFRHCVVDDLNGIRIHYVDENSSSDKVLLLLHGFPDLWFGKYNKLNERYYEIKLMMYVHFILIFCWQYKKLGWRQQIPFLASKGYRVIAPDLRGFGDTVSIDDNAAITINLHFVLIYTDFRALRKIIKSTAIRPSVTI